MNTNIIKTIAFSVMATLAMTSVSTAQSSQRLEAPEIRQGTIQAFAAPVTQPDALPQIGSITGPRQGSIGGAAIATGPAIGGPRPLPPQIVPPQPVQPPVVVNPGGPAATQGLYIEHVLPGLPATCVKVPRLEFTGRLIPGTGMQVVSVQWGGVAQRLGLEPGDIVVEINGRPIRTTADYEQALFNAAVYERGIAHLLIRNVRYQPGCSVNTLFVRRVASLPDRCHTLAGPLGQR